MVFAIIAGLTRNNHIIVAFDASSFFARRMIGLTKNVPSLN